jgi:hypothetical protein|tara:strand:- start:192 stop:716 length:525 start_codon:yes stop_codon:yes gene_type:complete
LAQEFTIKSEAIESKINQLLPSQGGFEPGVDFSASTMVVPIIDLTESAEGSSLRSDLQTSFSLDSVTVFDVNGSNTTDIITTPGYYRIFGTGVGNGSLLTEDLGIQITDGTTTKIIFRLQTTNGIATRLADTFDFNVFVSAGDTVQAFTNTSRNRIQGVSRQIATITGELVNPI